MPTYADVVTGVWTAFMRLLRCTTTVAQLKTVHQKVVLPSVGDLIRAPQRAAAAYSCFLSTDAGQSPGRRRLGPVHAALRLTAGRFMLRDAAAAATWQAVDDSLADLLMADGSEDSDAAAAAAQLCHRYDAREPT